MQNPILDLVQHVNNALRESHFPNPRNGYFASRNTLQAITGPSVARTIWPNSLPDRKLVEFISQQARELFAIAIIIGVENQALVDMMRLFMMHGKTDRSLPISEGDLLKMWPGDLGRRRRFGNSQHLFKPQTFPRLVRFSVIRLGQNTVLPILESQNMAQGQFGIVYKVRLHVDCLDLGDPIRQAQGEAAIKELRDSIDHEKARRAWNREVKALNRICQLRLLHIVDIAAMIVIGNKQYFLFPWAGGGNLINLWRARNSYGDRSTIARQHIPTIINQLVGLTGALARLHAFAHGNSESYRHGDLKPENILIFDVNNPGFLGVWKMADLGLARHHVIATGERSFTKSNFGAGTISYQPPETFRPTAAPTSRLYDVWCMGCIILQLMTWLHYGIEKVHELTGATKSGFTKGESSYWYATSWQDTTGLRGTRIHPAVTKHMAQMKLDVQGSGALQELLHIIETKLLVVQLPPNAVTTVPGCRTNAADLHQSLLRIQAQCNNPRYWNSGYSIAQQTGHLQIPQGWNLDVGGRNKINLLLLKEYGNEKISSFLGAESANLSQTLNDTWVRATDKTSILRLLRRPELRDFIASDPIPDPKLCVKCGNMDFFEGMFQIADTFQDLRREASFCDFCKMRWYLGRDSFSHEVRSILFEVVDSDLQLFHRPVISLLACHEGPDSGDDTSEPTDNWPQIGLPRLPPVGSEAHFTILRDWLEECDEQHEDCQPAKGARFRLPTRLIDVGGTGGTEVRLYETKEGDTFEYLALSHPWGPDRSSHFCTYPENLGHHLQGIPLKELPQTFQDAVEVTRSLKHQYLWIDSICIIQGPHGDFNEQAKHMEGIFRHAYCVLAASCAMDHQDGFLKPRDERRCLKLHQNPAGRLPIYACEFIDNFQQHALDSHLNKRGWVLQERALARRTIFFTEKQTYWECGAGVRCETSMTMNNKLASFLGDSRFPEIGMRSTHGSKILLFQDLYSKYSRLELSHDTDRPVAIAGIEKHLISSFEVRGGFGVLDDGDRGLLWRSLLWQRGHDAANELKRIDFQSPKVGTAVIISPPSWSWMAYKGAIDYLDLPFDGVDWEEDDIRFRWLSGTGNSWSYSGDCLACPLELTVCGRSFDLQAARASDSASIMLDDPDRTDELEPFLRCVVLGRSKGQAQDSSDARAHYVLLVTPSEPPGGGSSPIYNRAGVGYVPGALIDFTEQVVPGELR